MSAPVYSHGIGLLHAPELLVRQVIVEQIQILLGDVELQELLLRRVDTLTQGSQAEWLDDARHWMRGLADRLRVTAGYPTTEEFLPCLSVIKSGGGEDPTLAVCGDVWRSASEFIGVLDEDDPTAGRCQDHHELKTGLNEEIQIGAWAVNAEEASLLHTVARWALFSGKSKLHSLGLPEMSWTDGIQQPDGSPLYPHVPLVPTVSARLSATYQYRTVTAEKYRIEIPNAAIILPS